MLAIGFVTGELASFIWGGLFFFLVVYSWLGALIAAGALRRLSQENLRFSFKPSLPESNSQVEIAFSALALPFVLPGFFYVLQLRAKHSLKRRLQWHWRLSSLYAPKLVVQVPRGCYSLHATYEVRDIFGFSRVECPTHVNEIFTVVPSLATVSWTDNTYQETDGETQLKQKTSSQEFLDVRKYVPGDDIKRLHWGLFAHAREPFLRIGDEVPKQGQRQLFVVDTSTLDFDEEFLDLRLAQLNDYLQRLREPWLCLFPQEGLRAVGNKDLKQWAQTAAKLRAEEPHTDVALAQASLAGVSGCPVAVVSSQGCSGVTKLVEALAQHGFSSYTLFFPVKEKPKKQRCPWWMRQDSGNRDGSNP